MNTEREPGAAPYRIPLATYRLQFNWQFTFRQAADLAGYLEELGVSDVYASPLFKAGIQSTHGYDICGFDQLNPGLGSQADFDELSAQLRRRGMGLLLDMVPNHMGADLSNSWWVDVLEKGQRSRFATWFDIDWQPASDDLRDQVLLPTLEDHYGKVLEDGKIKVVLEQGELGVAYYDRRFPVSDAATLLLLKELLPSRGIKADSHLGRLKRLAKSLERRKTSAAAPGELKQQLKICCEHEPGFTSRLQEVLRELNGGMESTRRCALLHHFLQKQHYRLAFWRVGPEEINYRRFFDVTELVSLRMELNEVFEETHRFLFALLHEGKISGLRIDHPDGLWDPKQYFERLQTTYAAVKPEGAPPRLYLVAEKILTGEESLPRDWPIAGTTGYEFLNRLNGLFVAGSKSAAFDRLYSEWAGGQPEFAALVYASKKQILRLSLISEHRSLALRLKRIAALSRIGQDLTLRQLRAALLEVIAAFPVYRSYVTEATNEPEPADRDHIREALRVAAARNPGADPLAFDLIRDLLLLKPIEDLDEAGKREARQFVMRFQQLTGPVMAKGLEDTAFYTYNRLVSLNEVGGDPDVFGRDPDAFHKWNIERARQWPHSLLATATHDTKRGEDLRARLNVLSEIPAEWGDTVQFWSSANADKRSDLGGEPAPHPNDEYLFYQALVGSWTLAAETPAGLSDVRERLVAYLLKAAKEAKVRTTWTAPNTAYEEALRYFVTTVLEPAANRSFLESFTKFQKRISFWGRFNSLSQTLLKLACPGVPDFYQGCELWDFNLVDPDNRRPVDYAVRQQALAEIQGAVGGSQEVPAPLLQRLLLEAESGAIKLFLIWRVLQFRKAHREPFDRGAYMPAYAEGEKAEHVCAFLRVSQSEIVLAVVPRLPVGLAEGALRPPLGFEIWGDTTLNLPPQLARAEWQNVINGERLTSEGERKNRLPLAKVLAQFPVALLHSRRI